MIGKHVFIGHGFVMAIATVRTDRMKLNARTRPVAKISSSVKKTKRAYLGIMFVPGMRNVVTAVMKKNAVSKDAFLIVRKFA